MLTRIFGVTSLVGLVAIIAWINPGSVLLAALVILPYLFLLGVIHYQCIRLIQRLVQDYRKAGVPNPSQPAPIHPTHHHKHPSILRGLVL